jgi:hypothetical protein
MSDDEDLDWFRLAVFAMLGWCVACAGWMMWVLERWLK